MIDYTVALEDLPDPLPIEPLTKPFDVTITPPGSKSITNRAYVLAALAKGESRIVRPLRADDTDLLLEALCTLGAQAKWVTGETGDGSRDVLITGVDGRFPRGGTVNLGDGGTPTRFMIAVACLAAEAVVVDGSKRMRERPIAEGVDMLRQLGAKIEYVEEEGRLPVRITPSDAFRGGSLEIPPASSSQFISATLLIAAALPRGLNLTITHPITSEGYITLTTGTLRLWGIESEHCTYDDQVSTITMSQQSIPRRRYVVETDASGATYWTTAAAIAPASTVLTIEGVGEYSAQPDMMYTQHVLPQLGANVSFSKRGVTVYGGLSGQTENEIPMFWMPDAAVTLAAASALLEEPTTLTGLHTLRVKETDRIAALGNELRRVGCTVETTENSISVHPINPPPESRANPATNQPIIIETYNDHRMAMAFAVLGLRVPGIQIRDPACVRKSYPTFWRDFAKLYQ